MLQMGYVMNSMSVNRPRVVHHYNTRSHQKESNTRKGPYHHKVTAKGRSYKKGTPQGWYTNGDRVTPKRKSYTQGQDMSLATQFTLLGVT